MRAGPAGNDRDVEDVEKPKIINVEKENGKMAGVKNAGKKMRENDLLLRTTGISRNPGIRSK